MKAQKIFFLIATIGGALAVAAGAFGAHGLKPKLTPEQLAAYETGVRYHFLHIIVLLMVAIVMPRVSSVLSLYAGWCFVAGILLFSGSLYLLSCKSILHIEHWRWLGPITPIGGLLLIIGWLLLAIGLWNYDILTE